MNKTEVRKIIEDTLAKGTKTPGLFDISKALNLKNKLESCCEISDVICVLNDNQSSIAKMFGLSDTNFEIGIDKLKDLKQ